MVRFIKLIEDELKSGDKGNLKDKVNSILKKKGASFNNGNIKSISFVNIENKMAIPLAACKKDCKVYKDFYLELILIANSSLEKVKDGEKINSNQIKSVIQRLVNQFKGGYCYNHLISYTYLHTSDNFIISHMVNSAILTIGFSCSLGFSNKNLVKIGVCAFLHDVAMIHYFDLVNKKEKLTDEEFEKMKQHTQQSAEIIKSFMSSFEASVVMEVHEREEGQGYPKGKQWNEINLWSKIISICDIYTSLTHARSFRNDYNPFSAIKIIIGMKGKEFDERLVRQFVDYLSIYPINSFVYLNTGEIARVYMSNPGSPTRPLVQIVVNQDNQLENEFKVIDLKSSDLIHINDVVDRDKEKEIMSILIAREDLQ